MKLSKQCIDVGVQTNNLDPMLSFWRDEVGLPYEELLKVGGGTHQHRLTLNGSVFKLNSIRDPLPASGDTGYRELLIARDGIDAPHTLIDPDGNAVTLVPAGHLGITHIGLRLRVANLEAFQHFYREILELEEIDPLTWRWATTVFLLEEDASVTPATDMRGKGYRYITVQVWKVDDEHERVIERGGSEGRAPMTLGTTARISFIKDPGDNWIEVSQRASLTGDLSP